MPVCPSVYSLCIPTHPPTTYIIITTITFAFKGATRDFLQSPHSAANCLQHIRSSGPAQPCANHVQHIERLSRASVMPRATWYEGTAQLLSLTELKSHLFELYFDWLNHLTDEGTIKPTYLFACLASSCLSLSCLSVCIQPLYTHPPAYYLPTCLHSCLRICLLTVFIPLSSVHLYTASVYQPTHQPLYTNPPANLCIPTHPSTSVYQPTRQPLYTNPPVNLWLPTHPPTSGYQPTRQPLYTNPPANPPANLCIPTHLPTSVYQPTRQPLYTNPPANLCIPTHPPTHPPTSLYQPTR